MNDSTSFVNAKVLKLLWVSVIFYLLYMIGTSAYYIWIVSAQFGSNPNLSAFYGSFLHLGFYILFIVAGFYASFKRIGKRSAMKAGLVTATAGSIAYLALEGLWGLLSVRLINAESSMGYAFLDPGMGMLLIPILIGLVLTVVSYIVNKS